MFLRVAIIVTAFTGIAISGVAAQNIPETIQKQVINRDFIIAGGDGYGMSDCLSITGSCGRVVADAWCESRGYAKSVNYRKAAKDEVTASISGSRVEESFVITCSPQ